MIKYKSLFSPGKEISAAQYIVEILCKNKAAAIKITLPSRFWVLPEWAQFYKMQIVKASSYLEKYHEAILIKIIKQKNIYSLYAKWIDKEFDKETQITLELAKSIQDIQYERITKSVGKQSKEIDLGYLDN